MPETTSHTLTLPTATANDWAFAEREKQQDLPILVLFIIVLL